MFVLYFVLDGTIKVMPPLQPEQRVVPPVVVQPQKTGQLLKYLGWLVVVLAIFVFAGFFFGSYFSTLFSGYFGTTNQARGSIFLSLSPVNSKYVGIYQFDVSSRSLKKYFVGNNLVHVTPSFPSVDGGKMIFASNLSLTKDYKGKDPSLLQLYMFNRVTKEVTQLSTTTAYLKRHPVKSQVLNGYFYAGRPGKLSDVPGAGLKLGDWNVYFLDGEGRESVVDQGYNPLLSPDGTYLLYLKSDGLYLADLVNKKTRKVWSMKGGAALANMQLGISRSGDLLAWSNPNEGKLFIFKITSWNPFEISIKNTVDIHGFWPVFSPDGKHLAFEEVDWLETPTNPRLVVFDLSSLHKDTVFNLAGFVQTKMFVDDWIN